ncbi:hypothetical protein [Streptomyces sp. NPDC029004]|uniref:hypothetical protein n=1 Tax=Streptomyces sp. NPDC029004 TaxID=3154490 RepID=UPI0033EFA95D
MRPVPWLVAASAVLVLSGCVSKPHEEPRAMPPAPSETPTSRKTPPSSRAESAALLEQAVRRHVTATYTADTDTAYALLSQRCRDRQSLARYDELLSMEAEDLGPRSVLSFKLETLSGGSAVASYPIGAGGRDPRHVPWIWEDGGWLFDGCVTN